MDLSIYDFQLFRIKAGVVFTLITYKWKFDKIYKMKPLNDQKHKTPIIFTSKLFTIGEWTLLLLPQNASVMLPSRGMTMVKGIINDYPFQTALEPDGKGSHWFRVDETLCNKIHAKNGDTVTVSIEPVNEWSEPQIPADLMSALLNDSQVNMLWMDLTLMARWDWIRWIRSTKQPETRSRRIEIAFSKLKSGKRRPCCFNRTQCTETYVSHSGVLINTL